MKKLLLFLIFAGFYANAQWIHTGGPNSMETRTMASDSAITYAYIRNTECLYKSSDNGKIWTSVSCSPPDIAEMAVMGNTLVVVEQLLAVTVSTNGGSNWTYSNLAPSSLNTIVTHDLLKHQGKLFIASSDGVYGSSQNGANWSKCAGTTPTMIRCITATGGTFFAGTSMGVYSSTNDAVSWNAVNSPSAAVDITKIRSEGNSLAIASVNGIYYSANYGGTWMLLSTGISSTTIIEALEFYNGYLYAGTRDGLFRHDLVNSWQRFETGLSHPLVSRLHKSGPNLLAGTSSAGICRYEGSGSSWIFSSQGVISRSFPLDLVKINNIRYAGDYMSGISSDSAGTGWKYRNQNLYSNTVQGLSVVGNTLWAGCNGALYYSGNGGNSWTLSKQGIPEMMHVNTTAAVGNILLSGGCTTASAIFRSTDSGLSWSPVSTGKNTFCVFDLAVSGNTVYAATQQAGVLISTDQGQSWNTMSAGLPSTVSINVIKTNGVNLFAGASDGLYIFNTSQQSWNKLVTASGVNALAISGSSLYVGAGIYSTNGDLLHSPDNGVSWVSKTEGINFQFSIHSLLIDGTDLYAGLWGQGAWKRPLSQIFVGLSETPGSGLSIGVFPVPVSDVLTIRFPGQQTDNVEIIVSDLLGKEISADIISKEENKYQLDVSSLTKGMYLVSIRQRNEVLSTSRFIKE